MIYRLFWLPLCLLSCEMATEVGISGTIYDGPELEASILKNALVTIRDEQGVLYGETTTGSDGRFSTTAPGGVNIFLEVSGDEIETTSFTGISSVNGDFEVEDRLLYGVSPGQNAAWSELFEGCGTDEGGDGDLYGEIRVITIADPDTGEHPLVTSGVVQLTTEDGTVIDGCYLDSKGAAFAEDASATGASGMFAIRNVPTGVHVLWAGYSIVPDEYVGTFYLVWMPPDGVVPKFPTWVELALPG
jgi:hypothetical protein